jgi:hypothetical protein
VLFSIKYRVGTLAQSGLGQVLLDWGSDDPYCSCNWGHDPRRDNLEKLKKVSSLRELTS